MTERLRIDLMGMPVDALSEPEAIGAIAGALEAGRGGAVITAHLEILRRYVTDPSVREHFDDADLIVADGAPLVWAGRIMGTPLPERVAGSDLVWSLAAECALRERSVYLLGGSPGASEAAEARLRQLYPGLRIAGCESPPVGFDDDPAAIEAIRARLRAARPDVVFVALGFPKQERVIGAVRSALPNAWFLGVGVSLSFVAGHVARAPDWVIRFGLEWLHRLVQEPRRLFRRYLVDGLPFAARLFAHAIGRRVTRRTPPPRRAPLDVPASGDRVVFHHGSLERARAREVDESFPDGRSRYLQYMTSNGSSSTPLGRLSQLGQSVWVDFISREALQNGELARMVREDSVVGLTSNPTIFQKAIGSGDAYDEQLREVLEHETEPQEVFLALAKQDILEACDLLEPVWDENDGSDGYVSLEVDPTLAHDAEGTAKEAQRIWEMIDRRNLLVKIPGTKEGLQAIEDSIARGISVNVTLLFSLDRHAEVCDAYVRGLERLVADGGDPTKVASVASFFVSRVDSEVDKRLDDIGGHDELKGKVAVANAKLAYQTYKEKFAGDAWQKLADQGATPQRCLWASTSTKNPDYRDVIYVEELIGPNTVNTMPIETIEAFQDHGEAANTLEEDLDDARKVFDDLREAGVDMDDVGKTLEREGVEKFADSYQALLHDVKEKRDSMAARA